MFMKKSMSCAETSASECECRIFMLNVTANCIVFNLLVMVKYISFHFIRRRLNRLCSQMQRIPGTQGGKEIEELSHKIKELNRFWVC